MNKKEQEKLERLERRCHWLSQRIKQGKAEGKDLGYDKAELSALIWAIDFIRSYFHQEAS